MHGNQSEQYGNVLYKTIPYDYRDFVLLFPDGGGFGLTSVLLQAGLECVRNEKDESSFQCCIKDEGRPLIYALREEYINRFMVL